MKFNLFILMLLLVGCQPESLQPLNSETLEISPDIDISRPSVEHDQFFFTFDEDQVDQIHTSRGVNFQITDPIPMLRLNEDSMTVKKMKIRGNSAANVRRKSFNVDTEEYLIFEETENRSMTESKDFRLLAMPFDKCYIENRIGFSLLQKAALFPLAFKYVEVLFNGETNGTYLLIENPNDYFLDKNDYSILIRRGYDGYVDSYKYDEENWDGFVAQDYLDAFDQIYIRIKNYEGAELFTQINDVLDLRQYMRKIAFDYLIQNGDYTDEIYLYDQPGDDKIQFQVMAWDLDDLFMHQPHEIGNSWSTGKRFGDRNYATIEDVINEIGEKLIFSIEDDLDYTIAKDPYLYAIYLEELEAMMELITPGDIRSEFEKIAVALESFFADEHIFTQSSHDISYCNPQNLRDQIEEKKTLLINRRQEILGQL